MWRTNFELAALARVLPAWLILEVLAEMEKEAQRRRKLPPELVVWLVVGMGLFRSLSIKNVLDRVVGALGGVAWGPAEAPHATSIAGARDRLGWETVRAVFRRLVPHLRERMKSATSWRGLETYTLDGTCFLVPDSVCNDGRFTRPSVTRGGSSAFPQLRALMLVGVWTHLVVDVVLGPYSVSEMHLAKEILGRLPRAALLLLDRAYYGFHWPAEFLRRGVHFVVRMKRGQKTLKPRHLRRLGDGDWLCELRRPEKHRDPTLPSTLEVRMVKRARRGFRPIYVVTSLTSAKQFPAAAIMDLYQDRWEAELSYRELKTELVTTKVAFRSKTPDRVLQEVYGLLIAFNCVRALMAEAAAEAGVRPTQLSFVDALERLRLALCARELADHDRLVGLLRLCVLPQRRRGRRCERAVKVKFSNFPRKRRDRPAAPSPYVNRARHGRKPMPANARLA